MVRLFFKEIVLTDATVASLECLCVPAKWAPLWHCSLLTERTIGELAEIWEGDLGVYQAPVLFVHQQHFAYCSRLALTTMEFGWRFRAPP